jgi:hypothetical protein
LTFNRLYGVISDKKEAFKKYLYLRAITFESKAFHQIKTGQQAWESTDKVIRNASIFRVEKSARDKPA